ncbi:hypothetical protein TPHA_0H00740 [Tetrapisispora phaffii CBS 4417]|uniref:Phosphoribosylaminoimidazole-succinocarboxamide synthase n=1 Tax=Tetrapisispora phaffii (strain ATCC 24235 / CBS 4417 / NBRC 1672 / NRRL Y-8282 / UCD 70-5) TaxID=1071381 RepID=G8BWY0_TETPH|nr:hypothetical protein TPHA_0H00740 [Tetrapisispora phaffii CBS 4417]CCE64284.1 hypothetical protein TPHA_0H00740 [Tetrapisispora phaffii CBS 4417]
MSLTATDLGNILPLINRGKVRDIYQVDSNTLLFIATDRISAYDVIMENAIPNKGILLTKLSEFWFEFLKDDVRNHLVEIPKGKSIFDFLPKELGEPKYRSQIENRSMLINKFKLIPLEVIVRGYITGSAWSEYQKSRTVHGLQQPDGLLESQKFPKPIFTPSTKAEQGEHDENISIEQASKLIGKDLVNRVDELAVKLYSKCRDYAAKKGILIADTKFEFGIDEKTNEIILVDEVLTPDSSRFWNSATYELGKSQNSYDKQFLRDWLTTNKLKGVNGVKMPEDIVMKTRAKYIEAYERITGKTYTL